MTPIVTRLRCEHLVDPLGLAATAPRLSWQVDCARRGARQVGYRILASSSERLLSVGVGDVWDSGRVASADHVLVPYSGAPLTSRQQVFWSVRVWDDQGVPSPFSQPARWEMGLLAPTDWVAEWIAPPGPSTDSAVSYLRGTVSLSAPVVRARAYVTALGLYELHCNGARVGDAHFTPGWTDYAQRLQYQVYDLTSMLAEGDNVVGAVLADGWYAGYVGFLGQREHYGDAPQLLVQVEVETTDGRRVVHPSDEGWTSGPGALRSSDMLRGETYDASAADPLWCMAGGGAAPWAPVRRTDGTPARRVTSPAPPVRVLAQVTPVRVERVGPDRHLVDLGQNIAGWLRLCLPEPPKGEVHVQHAEILDAEGALYTKNLRAASATDRYLLSGGGARVCEPTFTFHGFRYAEISGYPSDLGMEDVTGMVCGSDVEQVGEFSCSDDRVNQLYSNIVWSARGNFLDVPTDCPQRDERLGWTGDAQVFAPTACYLFDMAGFFTKWLADLADGQSVEGSFPDVAPRVVLGPDGSAGWADAGVIVPTTVHQFSGDRGLLERMYPSMRRWVDYVHSANPDLLWTAARGYDNGDWLAPGGPTDKDLIASAFFARSARLTAGAAEALGRSDEAVDLNCLAEQIAVAFQAQFLRPDGRLTCQTQTAYALALRFGLIPPDLRAATGAHLAALVEADGRLATGFLGVGQLLPALTDSGRTDLAYRLLLSDGHPSWLQAVDSGATTVWERWDGWTAEAGFQDPEMNSFNHYAFGAVGEWLYRTVAGIEPASPGGERLKLAPAPCHGLRWARARTRVAAGDVESGWALDADGSLRVSVVIPVGATAGVQLPATGDAQIREAGTRLADADGVHELTRTESGVTVEVGSGRYEFTVSAGPESGVIPSRCSIV